MSAFVEAIASAATRNDVLVGYPDHFSGEERARASGAPSGWTSLELAGGSTGE